MLINRLFILMLFIPVISTADIYKATDSNGKSYYTDEPREPYIYEEIDSEGIKHLVTKPKDAIFKRIIRTNSTADLSRKNLVKKPRHKKENPKEVQPVHIETKEEEELRRKVIDVEIENARENPSQYLKIEKSSWEKTGFGTVAEITLTIKNSSPISFKDILIRCDLFANSGTKLDTLTNTIYEIINPNSKKVFKDVNLGFINSNSTKMGCVVINAIEII